MVKLVITIVLAASSAFAGADNVWTITNDVLDPSHESLSGSDEASRLTIFVTQSGAAVDLSNCSNTLTVTDARDSQALEVTDAAVLDATNGHIRFWIADLAAGSYVVSAIATPYADSSSAFTIAYHTLTITSATAAAACPDTTVNITNINNYAGDTFATNLLENLANVNAVASPTADDALVWNGSAWSNAPVESGSGTLTNGIGTNGITVTVAGDTFTAGLPDLIASSDQFLRSDGDSVFWSTDRWPLPEIGTNWIRFEYVADEPQYWTVPDGVTNVEFTLIGGAGQAISGTGGGGGGTRAIFDVSGVSTVRWVIAGIPVGLAGASAYYGGGTTDVATAAGGGLSGVFDDSTGKPLAIAGGGGGARAGAGGAGGGLSGGDGDGSYGGKGGTQTAGGLGSQGQTNQLMGRFFCGGTSTNSNTGSGGGRLLGRRRRRPEHNWIQHGGRRIGLHFHKRNLGSYHSGDRRLSAVHGRSALCSRVRGIIRWSGVGVGKMVKLISIILLVSVSCSAQVLLTLQPTNTTIKTLDMRDFAKARKAIRTGKDEDRMGVEDLVYWIEQGNPIPAQYPSLADPSLKISVPWTGNLTNDLAQIQLKAHEAYPARTNYVGKLKGKKRKEFVADEVQDIRDANGVPQLRDAVADMLEVLDARMDALEEARKTGVTLQEAE